MTCKIKRRSLRCGGRPKADFGSIFTTFIAPALGVAGSVADSAISKTQVSKSNTKPAVKETNTEVTNNNTSVENLPTIQVPTKEPISGLITSNTIIPSDPTKTPTMKLGGRKKCWIGAAIGAATSIAGSLFGNAARKREMRRQKSIQDWQNTTQEAANMTSVLNNSQDYQEDYLRQFRTAARLGKTLGAKGIYITDGGDATKIGNNTYLLRGGSHEDVNETGQTGIGINVGGNEVEAEGGEVTQKKNGALRIFSAQPILSNGMSPAQAILRGYNKDKVFSAQQAFKKRNGLKDDGSKAAFGNLITMPFAGIVKDVVDYFSGTGKYTPKRVKVSNKTVNRKPIRNGQVGNFRVVNSFNDIMNGTGREGISHRYYNRSLSKEDFDAIQESYNKINASFKARHPKASGKIRFAIGDDDVYDPLGNYKNYDDYLAQIASDRKTLRNATTINPDNGEPIAYFYNDGRNPLTQGHGYASSKWGVRISNPQDYNMKIFNGHLHYSNSKTIPFDSPNVEVFRSTPFGTIRYPKWMLRRGWYRNGGLTSKDRGSSKHPYPSVSSKDFAGGSRSYPIPTKADAVDALRLAGLHGRSDVRSKVYSKYPSLRKKSLLGSCSRPVKGMRPKAAIGIYTPYNERYTSIYDAPDYDSDYNGGNVLGNGEVTVTAKRIKPTFMKPNNDAMNLIKVPKEEDVPYIQQRHNRSRTIFSGGDYLGLGIDTLAALSTGLVNYNTAGKYVLPDRAPIIQASKLPTTYNVNPEIEEVKRYRDRLTGQTFNNTSSSVAALNRSGAINLDALSNLSKLWATKENEENKMLTEDAKNQQTVAAQNAQNELARQSEIARIKNEANQAKGDALNVGLSGLSQAWTNFWTAGRTAYEDDQTRRAMIASSKEATPTRLSELDFDLSPDILASLYRTTKDDRTKRFYLSRLSPKQRQKYGIN